MICRPEIKPPKFIQILSVLGPKHKEGETSMSFVFNSQKTNIDLLPF